jgi:hypothetical protein
MEPNRNLSLFPPGESDQSRLQYTQGHAFVKHHWQEAFLE